MAFRSLSAVLLFVASTVLTGADELKEGMTWKDVTRKGQSVVFGRLEGRFDGPDFHDRHIELQRVANGKEYKIQVGEGLGYFEAVIPVGSYKVTAIEATYYPQDRPSNPVRYRPVRQRFGLRPKADQGARIRADSECPVYVGTLQIDNTPDGIVYRGHFIQVFDEFDETYERLETNFPTFVSSLSGSKIAPARHYILKPKRRESPLELVEFDDPMSRAREYISEGKFQQAINWLQTFMSTSDRERIEIRLLLGEAYLGDGKYSEAIQELGDVLVVEAENLRALRLLARAHLLRGDDEDALSLYGALAQFVPGDAEAHLQLGYLYALSADSTRSADEFDSAFQSTYDYLLYDVAPFAMALKAVQDGGSHKYEPPRVLHYRVRPPNSMQSRRGSEQGRIALVIDHKGKVVAARVTPGTPSIVSMMLISMLHSTFKPAALNGIPVPSLLMMGEGGGGAANQ